MVFKRNPTIYPDPNYSSLYQRNRSEGFNESSGEDYHHFGNRKLRISEEMDSSEKIDKHLNDKAIIIGVLASFEIKNDTGEQLLTSILIQYINKSKFAKE